MIAQRDQHVSAAIDDARDDARGVVHASAAHGDIPAVVPEQALSDRSFAERLGPRLDARKPLELTAQDPEIAVDELAAALDEEGTEVLQELIENEKTAKGRLALDLTEVTVVSFEAVRALTVAEANGIELRNCPAYVREWISRGRECGLPE